MTRPVIAGERKRRDPVPDRDTVPERVTRPAGGRRARARSTADAYAAADAESPRPKGLRDADERPVHRDHNDHAHLLRRDAGGRDAKVSPVSAAIRDHLGRSSIRPARGSVAIAALLAFAALHKSRRRSDEHVATRALAHHVSCYSPPVDDAGGRRRQCLRTARKTHHRGAVARRCAPAPRASGSAPMAQSLRAPDERDPDPLDGDSGTFSSPLRSWSGRCLP